MTTPAIAEARILGDGQASADTCDQRVPIPLPSSRTAFAAAAWGTTRARSRGSSSIAAGTSWCRCQGSGTSIDLTTHLEACCAKRWAEQLGGVDQTVGDRLERDRAVLQRLPAIAVRRLRQAPGAGQFARRWSAIAAPITPSPHGSAIARCWSSANVHEVVISCAAEVIAWHARAYEQEDVVFDPLNYLSSLEQTTTALDQAAPLAGMAVERRCSAISAAYLKRGWAKPGSGNTSRCCV